MERINRNKLTSKNLIAIGIYNAVFFALVLIIGMIVGIVPVFYLFFYAIGSIALGPVYMLIIRRSPKKGTIVISGIIQGLIWTLMGLWHMVIFTTIGGILAEIIANIGQYRKKFYMVLSFVVFILGFYGTSFGVIIFFSDYYIKLSKELGGKADYITSIVNLVHGPMGVIAFIATIIGAVIGGVFGIKLLKKHFDREELSYNG